MQKSYKGMNPALEDPYYWQSFHNEFIACLHQQLSEILPSGYRSAISSEEIYEWFIEIRTLHRERKVVGIIEVLSPSNKAEGSLGWREYKQKQREILRSDVHLMEVDLLRGGTHTVAAPLAGLPPRSDWDYVVSLYRAPDRFHFPVWLNRLDEPLPEVRLPLLTGDPDVLLDLQKPFERAFKAGRYAEDIAASEP